MTKRYTFPIFFDKLNKTFASLDARYLQALAKGEAIASVNRSGHTHSIGWRGLTDETDAEFREYAAPKTAALLTEELRQLVLMVQANDEALTDALAFAAAQAEWHEEELRQASDHAETQALSALIDKLELLTDRMDVLEASTAHLPPPPKPKPKGNRNGEHPAQ